MPTYSPLDSSKPLFCAEAKPLSFFLTTSLKFKIDFNFSSFSKVPSLELSSTIIISGFSKVEIINLIVSSI